MDQCGELPHEKMRRMVYKSKLRQNRSNQDIILLQLKY